MLHQTIKKWSETYRDGILGKEEIITKYVVNPPIESTLEDNFIGRILWAISDKSGVPAKRFATLDPVPPIAWLESLTNNQFDCADLPRFGVTPNSENDKPTKFSFLKRHAPYTLSPSMALVSSGNVSSNWDSVMLELANWLLRHLNDPKLVLWIAKQGGQLHQRFAQLIKNKIENLDKLAIEDKEKLDRILLNSPNAIPNQNMRTLWRLVLSGRLKLDRDRPDLYNWLKRTEQNGVTATLKLELRVILEPRIKLSEPFQRNDKNINATNPQKIRDLVDWSIALSAEYAHSAFNKQKDNPYWKTALPDLFQDINMLLRDTLDLMQELGGACSKSDLSYIAQPSISPHPQNKHYHDWTTLIELARDAWLATAKISDNQARLLAEAWWHTPYPLFKRLALFAAAQETIVAPKKSLAWLLSDGSWWLWSNEVRRETIRLLVALAPKLNAEELIHLEQTILQGPPKNIFRGEIEPERYITIVDREILVRLSNIQATGVKITPESEIKLKVISNQNPQWIIGERDEFSSWTESSSDVTNNPWHKFLAVPRQRENLVAWLKKYPSKDYWNKDDWHQCCRDAFELTTGALCDLAHQDIWPTGRWKEALQAWNEERLLELSWKYVAPIIVVAPESLIKNCACEIGHWLRSIAKNCNGHDEIFFELIKGLLKRTPDNELPNSDLVYEAINHPIGIATEALLRWWYQKSPQDNQKLIDPFISIFIELCNTSIKKFIYGRILLAAHTIALFRVDRSWATTYLLPLFDWKKSKIEAQAAWKGFLWSPQPYLPLLSAIKQPLLATAEHYGRLGKHAKQYADLLTFVALEPGDDFTNENLAQAIIKLPTDGLKNSVQALGRALKGSGEKRGEYWHNRVLPYWKNIWPKSNDLILPEISESIACLCIDTSERFPDALNVLKDWLIPIKYPDYVIELLHQADLPTKFPEDSLELMNRIISEDTPWAPRKLSECLKEIITISSNLKTDIRYNRLLTYLKAHE